MSILLKLLQNHNCYIHVLSLLQYIYIYIALQLVTYNLITKHNFSSIQIEANPSSFSKLINTYKSYENKVFCYNEYVTTSNLKKFLIRHNFPLDFDLLSIDIDSYDYDIWKNFQEYTPKIVVIEVNSYRDPIVDEIHKKNRLYI